MEVLRKTTNFGHHGCSIRSDTSEEIAKSSTVSDSLLGKIAASNPGVEVGEARVCSVVSRGLAAICRLCSYDQGVTRRRSTVEIAHPSIGNRRFYPEVKRPERQPGRVFFLILL